MKIKVLIDNGHGSNTLGKRSPDGRVQEWKWNREVAKKVFAKLKAKGIDAELIVPEDNDVAVATRVRKINAICKEKGAGNVLLVSIHINADGIGDKWTTACGASTFVSKNASEKSKKVAKIFTDLYIDRGLIGNRSVPACKYWTWFWRKDDIYILKASSCPAVLTENLFMTNQKEVNILDSEAGKEKIADLHVDAIVKAIKEVYDGE